MNGRKENEFKTNKHVENIIKKSPRYVKRYYKTMNDKSHTTKHKYITYLLDFMNFIQNECDINVNSIECFKKVKPSTINIYIASLEGVSDSCKAAKLYGVKNFFNFLVADDIIPNNPCDRVAIPRDKKEHKITYLTKEEIDIVKNNIMNGCGSEIAKTKQEKWRSRDYAIIILGLSLGLRVTSICEIDVDDINMEANELKIIEKGNKMRTIMFSDHVKNVLNDWIQDREIKLIESGKTSTALFISNKLTRISSRTVAHLVEKYTYNIDKRITPHKLRSTCATNVYGATGDIYLTADILGHRNIANTRRYAQVSEERKKKAAAAMDDILF